MLPRIGSHVVEACRRMYADSYEQVLMQPFLITQRLEQACEHLLPPRLIHLTSTGWGLGGDENDERSWATSKFPAG
jgi:hypothetical protein